MLLEICLYKVSEDMTLRSDQLELQGLLKQTITLLCRNGLEYDESCVVDALVVVTTDSSQTFLVKVEETVIGQNVFGEQLGDDDECSSVQVTSRTASRKRSSSEVSDDTPLKRQRKDDDIPSGDLNDENCDDDVDPTTKNEVNEDALVVEIVSIKDNEDESDDCSADDDVSQPSAFDDDVANECVSPFRGSDDNADSDDMSQSRDFSASAYDSTKTFSNTSRSRKVCNIHYNNYESVTVICRMQQHAIVGYLYERMTCCEFATLPGLVTL